MSGVPGCVSRGAGRFARIGASGPHAAVMRSINSNDSVRCSVMARFFCEYEGQKRGLALIQLKLAGIGGAANRGGMNKAMGAIIATEWADRPCQVDDLITHIAAAAQRGMAMWAEHIVCLDAALALRARVALVHIAS